MMSNRFEHSSVIQVYHIYKDILIPMIGKTLQSRIEADNDHDDFAVALTIAGHMPCTISVPCNLFLQKGGTIGCTVTGPPQYSRDLEQGGQDVPCKLIFSAAAGSMKDEFKQKVQRLLQKAPKLERFAGLGITLPAAQSEPNKFLLQAIRGNQMPQAVQNSYHCLVYMSLALPLLRLTIRGHQVMKMMLRRKKVMLKRRFMLMVKKL